MDIQEYNRKIQNIIQKDKTVLKTWEEIERMV